MDMREKVARAIDPLAWALTAFDMNAGDLADYQEHHRPRSLATADAVLEAMRSPTEEMVEAAMDKDDEATYDPPMSGMRIDGPRIVWQAMIDAARTKESV